MLMHAVGVREQVERLLDVRMANDSGNAGTAAYCTTRLQEAVDLLSALVDDQARVLRERVQDLEAAVARADDETADRDR